jgi:hypothetical protein
MERRRFGAEGWRADRDGPQGPFPKAIDAGSARFTSIAGVPVRTLGGQASVQLRHTERGIHNVRLTSTPAVR